jgi:hypothetical protein
LVYSKRILGEKIVGPKVNPSVSSLAPSIWHRPPRVQMAEASRGHIPLKYENTVSEYSRKFREEGIASFSEEDIKNFFIKLQELKSPVVSSALAKLCPSTKEKVESYLNGMRKLAEACENKQLKKEIQKLIPQYLLDQASSYSAIALVMCVIALVSFGRAIYFLFHEDDSDHMQYAATGIFCIVSALIFHHLSYYIENKAFDSIIQKGQELNVSRYFS